jgi:hypothetical protein
VRLVGGRWPPIRDQLPILFRMGRGLLAPKLEQIACRPFTTKGDVLPQLLVQRSLLLAHGFSPEMVGRLVLDGLVTTQVGVMQAGWRVLTVTWIEIT